MLATPISSYLSGTKYCPIHLPSTESFFSTLDIQDIPYNSSDKTATSTPKTGLTSCGGNNPYTMSATRDISFKQVLEFARIQKKTIVPLGDWEKNPRLQAKTLVCLQYGELPEIEPYRIQHKVSHRLNHEIPQADFFAATSGNVTDEVIIKYIEQQTQEPPDGHFKIDDDL